MRNPIAMLMGAIAASAALCASAAPQDAPLACSVTAPNVTCVMTGLDNPRGLAFGPRGSLFVAEAGRGDADTKPCKAGTGFNCYGHTGAVTRLWRGEQVRVSTGMPSLSFVLGASARGPHDIVMWPGNGAQPSVLGEEGALVTIGLEMTATARDAAGRHDMGRLVRVPMDALLAPSQHLCTSCWASVVDIAPFQPQGNPDPNRESDPYGLLFEKGTGQDDDSVIVVDSSRNWLTRVGPQGEMSVVATFPARFEGRSTDAVPTTVVSGPDGDYYVGELVGIPFQGPARPPANIYRVSAEPPHDVSVLATGFNAVIDVAFHAESLYVLQHWSSQSSSTLKDGRLIRIACHDRPLVCDGEREVLLDGLDGPTSVLVGRGAIYVSNHGAAPGFVGSTRQSLGEVLRLALDDEDASDTED